MEKYTLINSWLDSITLLSLIFIQKILAKPWLFRIPSNRIANTSLLHNLMRFKTIFWRAIRRLTYWVKSKLQQSFGNVTMPEINGIASRIRYIIDLLAPDSFLSRSRIVVIVIVNCRVVHIAYRMVIRTIVCFLILYILSIHVNIPHPCSYSFSGRYGRSNLPRLNIDMDGTKHTKEISEQLGTAEPVNIWIRPSFSF